MNNIIIPGKPQSSSIVTQTRKKWDIPNNQSYETSEWEQRQLTEFQRRYPKAYFRTGAIPVYNCHGLTFGGRRTTIWETPAIHQILKDDHYCKIQREQVQPGDIILYVSAEDGDIEHSGIIVEPPHQPLWVPKVWSKWGFGAEVIHWANNCPYDFSQARYYRIHS